MAKKKDNTILWVGGAVAAYFLFFKPKTGANTAVTVTQQAPQGLSTPTTPVSQQQPNSSLLTSLTNLGSGLANLISPGATPNASNQIAPGTTTTDSVQQLSTPALDMTAPNTNALEAQMYAQYQAGANQPGGYMSGVKMRGCNGFQKDHYYAR